jgi:hypothetical protein
MSLANRGLGLPGVLQASAMMGTPQNRELLRRAGLLTSEGEAARPNDLIIALRADNDEALQQALLQTKEYVDQRRADIGSLEVGQTVGLLGRPGGRPLGGCGLRPSTQGLGRERN